VTATVAATLAAAGTVAAVLAFGGGADRPSRARLGIPPGPGPSLERASAAVGRLPVIRRIRLSERTRARLASAGLPGREREVVAAKVMLALGVGLACALVLPILALPLGAVCYGAPDLVVARLARRRRASADREIPVLLDLLALATSAGLPPQLAFRRAVETAEGPLADEMRSVLNATDLGGRWAEELSSAAKRLALPDLRRLVGALTRAQTLGASLAEEISRLASDVRERRRAGATERARAAPVKMLFPLVFLVLPAFLLLTVVPVLVTTVQSIR
jgi:tight adherence protein C